MSVRTWAFSDIESYLTNDLPRFRPEDEAGDKSLRRMRRLLRHLGYPQHQRPTIHLAGTAGKGSVAAYISGILLCHGVTVGTHLSPHLYDIRERFLVNCEPPSHDTIRTLFPRVFEAIQRTITEGYGAPSFFEATNALAFQVFAASGVDRVVLEVDLGGRFDSTNVVRRQDKLAVVTRLGLDHTETLGPTIEDIAYHKAGILPRNGSAVVLRQPDPVANRIISRVAAQRKCRVMWVDPDVRSPQARRSPAHLEENRAVAMAAAELVIQGTGRPFDPMAAVRGIERCRLPGRFEERMVGDRRIILDGAHNPTKMAAFASQLRSRYPGRRFVCVMGFGTAKDAQEILREIADSVEVAVVTRFVRGGDDSNEFSTNPAALANAARRAGINRVVSCAEPAAALTLALEMARDDDPVVVTGSFHLLQNVSNTLRDLATDREDVPLVVERRDGNG